MRNLSEKTAHLYHRMCLPTAPNAARRTRYRIRVVLGTFKAEKQGERGHEMCTRTAPYRILPPQKPARSYEYEAFYNIYQYGIRVTYNSSVLYEQNKRASFELPASHRSWRVSSARTFTHVGMSQSVFCTNTLLTSRLLLSCLLSDIVTPNPIADCSHMTKTNQEESPET